ncbi:translation initiation factor IF-2 [Verrucomicrobium sp. GAS474]|uniref:translation initiation factor IF-2 n=1 Tax=Verrucomicrobium sp. GAS474 TaxID=1882831 RepID=UPI00087C40EE|nr:translation initiation factor IF-2 [Verrucomicrobium sp. GAS474]SDU17117.1 translation initiation factor IF-2 [Verrucomicrobium sp. GAS474]
MPPAKTTAPATKPSAPAAPAPATAAAPAVETPVGGGNPGAEAASEEKLITIKGPVVVKDLAGNLGLKPFQLIHHLMELNIFATLTQVLDEESAKKVCTKLGYSFHTEKRDRAAHPPTPPTPKKDKPKKEEVSVDTTLKLRAPVVTFMGHVDHGKTSLLDAIRKTRVASGEAGGITQHIGAYSVKRGEQHITFIDTPGHAAFTEMRSRGAKVTDIVVIVVASDDGLMPQTLEAIAHAKAAKAPIMVAINKCDLPAANPMKVKGQLQEQGLAPEEYGGDTIVVEVSATKGTGIDALLDMILLQAEVLELKARYTGDAKCRVIESQTEVGRGPTATVLVLEGCLKVGEIALCGPFYGRVKALIDDMGKNVKEATPSTPVKVIGLDGVPSPGEELVTLENERQARTTAEERAAALRTKKIESAPKVTLENLFATIADGQKKVLNLIIKGDVQGSLEAVVGQLRKIESKKVDLEVVHTAVGPISESDILLAKASQAIVIGFGTKTDNAAANAAKREGIQIKLFSIIYELVDQIKDAMAGLLDPELRENQIGTAIVKKVFDLSKYPVAGCSVQTGRVTRNARARIIRRKQPIYDGGVQTLKRFQDDVSEVRSGMECGIRLGDFTEYEEGDIIECYTLEKFPQSL